jgi:intracellular sulfur oxidation DsrE/DsrF family protein
MSDQDQNPLGRRNLLANIGVAAVAGLAAGAVSAQPSAARPAFEPRRHAQDAWMANISGDHRVFIDSSTSQGGGSAVWYASNILNAHEESYDGSPSDYAMIVCFRHMSTTYGFDDALWAKYGAVFARGATPVPTANPMRTPSGINGQNTITTLIEKGVQFAICGRASQRFAMAIAQATGASAEAVYAELQAGMIPQAHMVPAGVIAATRAQEYRYSLLYAE